MLKFEKVSRFADLDFALPVRKTANSAGYDMVVAEDIIIPPYENNYHKLYQQRFFNNFTPEKLENCLPYDLNHRHSYIKTTPIELDELANITKISKSKPTLVSTGVKCCLEEGTYLELSVRSSTPLKYWLILANGVGIIDADYYNNQDNEGEIFFQLINLSPFPIQLRKGDIIGQGIIKTYLTTDNDVATGERIGGFGSTNG